MLASGWKGSMCGETGVSTSIARRLPSEFGLPAEARPAREFPGTMAISMQGTFCAATARHHAAVAVPAPAGPRLLWPLRRPGRRRKSCCVCDAGVEGVEGVGKRAVGAKGVFKGLQRDGVVAGEVGVGSVARGMQGDGGRRECGPIRAIESPFRAQGFDARVSEVSIRQRQQSGELVF